MSSSATLATGAAHGRGDAGEVFRDVLVARSAALQAGQVAVIEGQLVFFVTLSAHAIGIIDGDVAV